MAYVIYDTRSTMQVGPTEYGNPAMPRPTRRWCSVEHHDQVEQYQIEIERTMGWRYGVANGPLQKSGDQDGDQDQPPLGQGIPGSQQHPLVLQPRIRGTIGQCERTGPRGTGGWPKRSFNFDSGQYIAGHG